jgi:hypothetical protein
VSKFNNSNLGGKVGGEAQMVFYAADKGEGKGKGKAIPLQA